MNEKKAINIFPEHEFFEELFAKSFTKAPKKNKNKEENLNFEKDSLGYVHFAFVSEKINKGKVDKVPYNMKTARTFKTFFYWLNEPSVHWYTPNTFCTAVPVTKKYDIIDENENKIQKKTGGRREKNVRWLNAIFVDIDSKDKKPEEIRKIIKLSGLPDINVINETKRGYHFYWFLDERVPGTPNAKKLYKLVSKNIILILKENNIKVDIQVNETSRYMQIPRNIIFSQYNVKPSFKDFKIWLNRYGKKNYKNMIHKNYKKEKNNNKYLAAAIQKISNGVIETKRHQACFCLACYYKNLNFSEEKTTEILIEWNFKNENIYSEHSESEVINTVKSVFSSEKEGLPYNFITDLTGIKIFHFNKHKRSRTARVNSHEKEWAFDILLKMLKLRLKFFEGSQQEIASFFKIPISTFKNIINKIKSGSYPFLKIEIIGKGRNAKTIILLNEIFIKKNNIEKIISKEHFKKSEKINFVDFFEKTYKKRE